MTCWKGNLRYRLYKVNSHYHKKRPTLCSTGLTWNNWMSIPTNETQAHTFMHTNTRTRYRKEMSLDVFQLTRWWHHDLYVGTLFTRLKVAEEFYFTKHDKGIRCHETRCRLWHRSKCKTISMIRLTRHLQTHSVTPCRANCRARARVHALDFLQLRN